MSSLMTSATALGRAPASSHVSLSPPGARSASLPQPPWSWVSSEFLGRKLVMDGEGEKWVVELLTPSGSLRTMPGQSCPCWGGRSSTHAAWPSPPLPPGRLRSGRAKDLQPPYCLCFPAMVFSALSQPSTCGQVPQHSVQVPRICRQTGADLGQSLCPALLLQSQHKLLQNLCQP